MTRVRNGQAGVTLLEMLVALSISALIGLAGFVLLESVTRSEAGVAGRLERLNDQDRAFRLLALDASQARHASLADELVLQKAAHMVTWHASETGLVRRVTSSHIGTLEQVLLQEPVAFSTHRPGVAKLTITGPDIWRLVPLPRRYDP